MFSEIVRDTLKILPKSEVIEEKTLDNLKFNIKQNLEGDKIVLEWKKENGIKYEIYRDEKNIGSSKEGTYSETLTKAGTYNYKIIGYNIQSGKKVYESKIVPFELIYKEPIVEEKPKEEKKEEKPPIIEEKPVIEKEPPPPIVEEEPPVTAEPEKPIIVEPPVEPVVEEEKSSTE
jgi:hypothetical protein